MFETHLQDMKHVRNDVQSLFLMTRYIFLLAAKVKDGVNLIGEVATRRVPTQFGDQERIL